MSVCLRKTTNTRQSFTKKKDLKQNNIKHFSPTDVSKLRVPFFGALGVPKPKELAKPLSIHEQNDGTIFAICATGTSTKDSLLSWIRLLEKTNPCLSEIPVLFKFKSIVGTNIVPVSGSDKKNPKDIEEIKVV